MDKIKFNEKSRFIIKCSIDKEAKECEFEIDDSWASYGATITFHLVYPYSQVGLDKWVKESKIALRKDYIDAQREGREAKRFFTIGSFVGIIILVIIISQAI